MLWQSRGELAKSARCAGSVTKKRREEEEEKRGEEKALYQHIVEQNWATANQDHVLEHSGGECEDESSRSAKTEATHCQSTQSREV
jgi:hypothetical protein